MDLRLSLRKSVKRIADKQRVKRPNVRTIPPALGLDSVVLAAAIVHEVRRLLTPARAYAELAMRSPGLSSDACMSLQAIITASAECELMMDCLLQLGQGCNHCDVGELIRCRFDNDADLKLKLHTDCVVPLTEAAVESVISNLVSNAKRATGSPASIHIVVSRSTGNLVTLEVRDVGSGMSQAQVDGALQPFVSHSSSSGVGLAICRAIVESVGGSISIQSRPGHGTVVTVTLPVVEFTNKKAA